jgi:hypothetical protein
MLAVCALIATLCHPTILAGQATNAPVRPDGHKLRLGTDSFAVYLIRGADTTLTGSVIDALTSDGPRLIRVYISEDRVLGSRLDTIIDRLPDLTPIAYHSRSSQLIAHLAFDTAGASGWVRLVNGDSTPVQVPFDATVYNGATFDLIVRSSRLAPGLQLTVPSFLAGPNSVVPIHGAVSGSAVVDGHPCWVFAGDFATVPLTLWIDKSTRTLRRQLMQLRVDAAVLFTSPPRNGARKRAT